MGQSQSQRKRRGGGWVRTLWPAARRYFDYACAYCNAQDEELTRDHVVPLSRGGDHHICNVVPACCACNQRKGCLLLHEWIPEPLLPRVTFLVQQWRDHILEVIRDITAQNHHGAVDPAAKRKKDRKRKKRHHRRHVGRRR